MVRASGRESYLVTSSLPCLLLAKRAIRYVWDISNGCPNSQIRLRVRVINSVVLLTFVSIGPRKGRAFNLPAWIFKLAGARELFAEQWMKKGCPLDPFEALKSFAAVARTTTKEVLRKRRAMDSSTQLGKLSGAISLLRMLDSPHPISRRIALLSRPELASCFLSGRPD